MVHCVAEKLFTQCFDIEAPLHVCYSPEQLDIMGVPGCTTDEETIEALNRYTHMQMNLPNIALLLSEGTPIRFTNPTQLPVAHELLKTHLDNWLNAVNVLPFMTRMPPVSDFMKLDELLGALSPYAQRSADELFLDKLLGNPFSLVTTKTDDVPYHIPSNVASKLYPFIKRYMGADYAST